MVVEPVAGGQPTLPLLHVIATLDPRSGGTAEGLRQLAAEAARVGDPVEILTLDPPGAPWLAGLPFTVHALGRGRLGTYQWSSALRPFLRRHGRRFAVIIVHGLWQYHGFAVRVEAMALGVPYFVFAHGMLDPWFRRRYPLKHLKKWLYWPWGEYRVLRDAAAVLFASEEERRLARDSFTLYRARERLLPLGTPGPAEPPGGCREAFLARFPDLQGHRLVLFLGRIHEKKGVDLLLAAFAAVAAARPEVRLVMAGPDPGNLRERLCANGTDSAQVVWTGMLEGALKWGALAAAEVFVLPSHQENFGIAVVEALACGTPVLVSDKVNIWREVVDTGAGFAEDDSLAGVVRLLEGWFSLDEAGRAACASRALPGFQRHFHISATHRRLVQHAHEQACGASP